MTTVHLSLNIFRKLSHYANMKYVFSEMRRTQSKINSYRLIFQILFVNKRKKTMLKTLS
jgi:hypothetical protein